MRSSGRASSSASASTSLRCEIALVQGFLYAGGVLRNLFDRTDGTPEPCSGIDTTGPTSSPWCPSSASASSPSSSSSTACSTTTSSSTSSAATSPGDIPGPALEAGHPHPSRSSSGCWWSCGSIGWSYEQAEYFVNDSLVLRQFCRVYLEKVPDDTTLIRWANTIGPETVEKLNDRVVQLGPGAEGDAAAASSASTPRRWRPTSTSPPIAA